MRFPVLLLVIFATVVADGAVALEVPLPDGWRLPNEEEMADVWRLSDSTGSRYLYVAEDFNGDGQVDLARLLVSTNTPQIGLYVTLDVSINNRLMHVRLEQLALSSLRSMGVSRVAAGVYRTACGKGYWDCAPGEPTMVTSQTPAINLFKTESANAYYVWLPSSREFRKYWISD